MTAPSHNFTHRKWAYLRRYSPRRCTVFAARGSAVLKRAHNKCVFVQAKGTAAFQSDTQLHVLVNVEGLEVRRNENTLSVVKVCPGRCHLTGRRHDDLHY